MTSIARITGKPQMAMGQEIDSVVPSWVDAAANEATDGVIHIATYTAMFEAVRRAVTAAVYNLGERTM